jgi:hypothetical protein
MWMRHDVTDVCMIALVTTDAYSADISQCVHVWPPPPFLCQLLDTLGLILLRNPEKLTLLNKQGYVGNIGDDFNSKPVGFGVFYVVEDPFGDVS